MPSYINSLLEILQNILGQAGVPEASRPLGAMLTLYLLITLLVLLLVVIVWRRSRRKSDTSLDVDVSIAEPEEMPVEQGAKEEQSAFEPKDGIEKPEDEVADEGLIKTVRSGLQKTRDSLVGRLEALFKGQSVFSPELLEELEEVLITSDFGMATTMSLVNALEQKFSGKEASAEEVYTALKDEIATRLNAVDDATTATTVSPQVVMVVGVNGVGKTTTIGKLASHYSDAGKSVLLAAGDTFRAAAAEQLSIWAERSGADIVRHAEGGDPAAVTFDAAKAAVARKSEVLIVDTAGRLHTKTNLMEELKKVRRVLDREIPGAPHQTLLVVDATTGQNALVQAKMFQEAVQIDGIVLTKLDGTAKGGIVVAICSELSIPVRFVGVGEGVLDLRPFDAGEYVEGLFGKDEVA